MRTNPQINPQINAQLAEFSSCDSKLAHLAQERAILLVKHGRLANAAKAFEKALQLDSQALLARLGLISTLKALNQSDLASEEISKLPPSIESQELLNEAFIIGKWADCFTSARQVNQFLNSLPTNPPTISMSLLGIDGRFGNQIFQYMFLKLYAASYGLRVEVPYWCGSKLYKIYDHPLEHAFPMLMEPEQSFPRIATAINQHSIPFKNIDLAGYFQLHTGLYAPRLNEIKQLFQLRSEIEETLQPRIQSLRSVGKTLVCIHVRRGDVAGTRLETHIRAYLEWLDSIWGTLERPVLAVLSDEANTVREFDRFRPAALPDVRIDSDLDFFPDFYTMMNADVLAISNSSFSYCAAMFNKLFNRSFNTVGCRFYRPMTARIEILPDPWNGNCTI